MMDEDFAALRALLDEPPLEQGEVTPPELPGGARRGPRGAARHLTG